MNQGTTRTPGGSAIAGRSAALLIDFDNVTMNVRSDLGKELQALLNSEVFRGKIAVRRAYADWRRYPSSVVPMTEASVDLIFAPAYGTSKKNATDLRMAVDAIELAFMRPEIGTFILLTGDSDFSSCVMKLKEYGKYVIGVGMRESASDLLIQNCDEYYSYHNLSGLTRATDDTGVREDPWELTRRALEQMVKNGDVMRVDRLKQVMLELDPGFSEKDIGYSKFSKFISEAQSRGVVRLHRDGQGNWDVSPPAGTPETDEERAGRERERESRRDRERERSHDRDRERRRDRERSRDGDRERPARPERPEPQPVAAAPEAPAAEEPRAPTAEAAPESAPSAAPAAAVDPLRNAFSLLQHTLRQMVRGPGDTVRDGDLKRRMLEADPGFDEGTLGFSKFSRFLRQAHDGEVVDVRRLEDGGYEVLLPAGGKRLPAPVTGAAAAESRPAESGAAEAPSQRGGRGRGRGRRGEPSGPPPLLPGQVAAVADGGEAEPDAPAAREPEVTPAQARQELDDSALIGHREPAVATARIEDPASIANRGSSTSSGSVGIRGGRGRRGAPSGPPPLLPGQVVPAAGAARPQETAPEAREPETAAPAPKGPRFSAESLGLSTERGAVVDHLASYRGVGRRSAESLHDAYGDDVYRIIEEQPDAVRVLLGRRAAPLLEQWAEDRDARRAERAEAKPEQPTPEPQPEAAAEEPATPASDAAPETPAAGAPAAAEEEEAPARGRGRGRRGGRGRARAAEPAEEAATEAPESPAAEADAAPADTAPEPAGDAGTEDTAAEAKPARSRGRRGGRGRTGKARAAEADGSAPEAAPEPEPAPEPQPEAAAEEPAKPARRTRGRGRGKAAADAAPVAGEAPEPEAPLPAPEEKKPAARKPRARGRAKPAADAAPAPEAKAAEPAADEAKAPARRSRRGGRGRAKGSGGDAA